MMSQINIPALSRIASSNMSGGGVGQLFVMLAEAARVAPTGSTVTFSLGFQQPGDKVSPGDLFPHITLSLVPSSEMKAVDGSDHPKDSGPVLGATG